LRNTVSTGCQNGKNEEQRHEETHPVEA